MYPQASSLEQEQVRLQRFKEWNQNTSGLFCLSRSLHRLQQCHLGHFYQMALFVERWAVLCSCFYSLCAQSHTAVTLTVRPVILCILHPQMGAESQHRVDEWDERQFTAAHRLQSLKTIKFPLERQAPHSYSCPCTRSTPGQEAEAIFWERWRSGEGAEGGYSIHMER